MSKKLYIYDFVEYLTTNWHAEGGLVVITAGDPQSALIDYIEREDDEKKPTLPDPIRVFDVSDDEPDGIYIFPDAGCC